MMNTENIIRMAQEAGMDPAHHPFNPWSASQEALEKFAELIVQECIERISRVGILEDIEFQSGMIAQNVREHFGVDTEPHP